MGDLIGYARVSTTEQNPALQLDALRTAGCERVFTEDAGGAFAERAELARALDHLRAGDTLVVWKLDRLGRSLRHLIDTVRALEELGVGFRSLQEQVDTTTPGGRLVFNAFGALAECEVGVEVDLGGPRGLVLDMRVIWQPGMGFPVDLVDLGFALAMDTRWARSGGRRSRPERSAYRVRAVREGVPSFRSSVSGRS